MHISYLLAILILYASTFHRTCMYFFFINNGNNFIFHVFGDINTSQQIVSATVFLKCYAKLYYTYTCFGERWFYFADDVSLAFTLKPGSHCAIF